MVRARNLDAQPRHVADLRMVRVRDLDAQPIRGWCALTGRRSLGPLWPFPG